MTAPVEIRERVTATVCPRDEVSGAFLTQLDPSLFSEALVLSTCNRTEVYAVTHAQDEAEQCLRRLLAAPETLPGVRPEML